MDNNIVMDNENNCTFFNNNLLKTLQKALDNCRNEISKQKTKKEILRIVKKYIEFKQTFKNRGVQGITGIVKIKGAPIELNKVVFKISVDLDRAIEHEYLITKELNNMREYCPHFVGNIGMINVPISNDFINEPDREHLLKNSNDYFPCNMLILEYISPVSFYHVCKYLSDRKSIVISQLLQIMMAIDIAQQKHKLTHYDLHLDNILIRNCEENSLFLYLHKDKNILIPTYGLYPVIIDFGSSYINEVDGHYMYTSANNYQNGLQPTLYDNLNDIHHLLISALFYLEDKGYVYDYLRTRFMHLFRYIPIMAQKGWKQLPNDILHIITQKIVEDIPDIKEKFPVYRDYKYDIIDILNGLIILPWSETEDDSFSEYFPLFLQELEKLNKIKCIQDNQNILYILRETVTLINSNRTEILKEDQACIKKLYIVWKQSLLFIFENNLKAIPDTFNFSTFIITALKVSDKLSSNYYNNTRKNVELINDSYLKTPIKSPLDVVFLLMKLATPTFTVTNESKVYVWDTKHENKMIITLDKLTQKQLDIINDSSIVMKGTILKNIIKHN